MAGVCPVLGCLTGHAMIAVLSKIAGPSGSSSGDTLPHITILEPKDRALESS